MPHGTALRSYSNCAVIDHFTCQTAYVTGSSGMSYCNQTLFLSGRVGSGDKTMMQVKDSEVRGQKSTPKQELMPTPLGT